MYQKPDRNQIDLNEFILPFGGWLSPDNRWIKMASLMPWEMIEDFYAESFKGENPDGRRPLSARIAFGAIYIKEQEGLTDRGTVEYIAENPYAQYFLGLNSFRTEPLFDDSMMTWFRKRFSMEMINQINEELFRRQDFPKPPESGKKDSGPTEGTVGAEDTVSPEHASPAEAKTRPKEKKPSGKPPEGAEGPGDGESREEEALAEVGAAAKGGKNAGILILDATAAPADIRYPTDISILNECRENTEQMIDEIWEYTERIGHKTAYNRKKARGEFLKIIKKRRRKAGEIKEAIQKQIEYVKRNLEALARLMGESSAGLKQKRLDRLETIHEVVKQQEEMLAAETRTVENRIVSLRQPHVRPIVRGKARAPVEFGQKLAFSVVSGFTFIDKQGWDNFNEGITLIESAEKYKERHGVYPEAILADTLYRNRDNIKFCKLNGIRLSGPRLGRPKADEADQDKEQAYRDSCARNMVESRNGIVKRRYGMDLIMSRLECTSETEMALNVLAMNMAHVIRVLSRLFFKPRFWRLFQIKRLAWVL
jgi:hypothetical protein